MIRGKIDISGFIEVHTEQKVIANLVKIFVKRRKEDGLTQKRLSEK